MKIAIILILSFGIQGNTQVLLTTTYFEDFGSTDITAWTDNSTILGWYATDIGSPMHEDITVAAPSNAGRFYSYECNGDNDQKIGSRASGGTGTIYYGVRLRNNSGAPIDYLLVEFDWYQLSLAENGGNVNTISFSYQVGPTVTSLTAGAWTNFAALDYTAPMSSGACCSAQIEGYPCTQTGSNSACINVTIPAGEEIMLRFTDGNDGANDHHMAIDNFFVGIATEMTCSFILSATLSNFTVIKNERENYLMWETLSESNTSHFELEWSEDGKTFQTLQTVIAAGNSSTTQNYSYSHFPEKQFSIIYYRLKSVDFDGSFTYSSILSVNRIYNKIVVLDNQINLNEFSVSNTSQNVIIYDINGRKVYESFHYNNDVIPWQSSGLYIIHIPASRIYHKFIIP